MDQNRTEPDTPTRAREAVKFDWWMRDALRQAAVKKTIRRDRRTKRGVAALIKLGLLVVVKQTDFNTTYAITDLGRQVVPQLPTSDEEWAALTTDKYRDFGVVLEVQG